MSQTVLPDAWLVPLPGGPALGPMKLSAGATGRPIVLGRNKDCDLRLPIGAEEVSRRHAELVHQDGQWRIADLGSRWGTVVNGMRIESRRLVPVGDGDLIRIHPWTFRFSTRGAAAFSSVAIEEDAGRTIVRTLTDKPAAPLQQDMLNLLLEASALIQAAGEEAILANVLCDTACRGTGLANSIVLRALDAEGNVAPMSGDPQCASPTSIRFSRSLLAAAARGAVAEFSGGMQMDVAMSIVSADIRAAICAPLMLGTTVAAYLYVDSRGSDGRASKVLRPNASGFVQALARMGGLALANLRRLDTERRAAHMEAELNAAAEAQRWIQPGKPIQSGPLVCRGRTRPGGYLGGDFFDAQILDGEKLAVTLGDVSGHGAAASVLMTAAQGFLHASLANQGDLGRAVGSLNAFVQPRCPSDKFITLWSGVFDPRSMTLDYVDAGHGFAMLLKTDGTVQMLNAEGGPPIGVDAGYSYQPVRIQLSPGEQVLILSDGIIEQLGADAAPDSPRQQFGLQGVEAAIRSAGQADLVEAIFQAMKEFAGGENFSDDTTAVLVRWPA